MKKDKGIKFETLKKPRLIRNLVILFMITFIGSAIYFKTSSAKYQTTQVIPIINTKVVNKPWWTLTIKETGKEDKVLKSGPGITENNYIFDYQLENGYSISSFTCTRREGNKVENEIEITIENKKLKITDSAKHRGTVCELAIEKKEKAKDKILADNSGKEIIEVSNFSKTACDNSKHRKTSSSDKCTDTTHNGLYKTTGENEQETYYFRGSVNNNWVKFGKNSEGQNIWWRIIRINEDGTIRLIYAGEGNNPSNIDPNYGNEDLKGYFMTGYGVNNTGYKFNNSTNNSEYVGYMYTKGQQRPSGTNGTPSNAKTIIDEWYNTNMSSYSYLIDGTTGFCGDRTYSTTNSGKATNKGWTSSKTVVYYGAYLRLETSKNPSYGCPNKEDLYTTPDDSNKGNGALSVPVGLITADEVAYAGGLSGKANYGYWLYTGNYYWTLSPRYFDDGTLFGTSYGISYVFGISSGGALTNNYGILIASGFRPVINLKSEVCFSEGEGTIDKPYIIMTDAK